VIIKWKRQQQHSAGIVKVQPRTLALVWPESEELLEDLLVNDNTGDQRSKHHQRQRTDHEDAPVAWQVEGKVEAEEEVAARCRAPRWPRQCSGQAAPPPWRRSPVDTRNPGDRSLGRLIPQLPACGSWACR
jgi:Ni/Co efflux regulator RcnB